MSASWHRVVLCRAWCRFNRVTIVVQDYNDHHHDERFPFFQPCLIQVYATNHSDDLKRGERGIEKRGRDKGKTHFIILIYFYLKSPKEEKRKRLVCNWCIHVCISTCTLHYNNHWLSLSFFWRKKKWNTLRSNIQNMNISMICIKNYHDDADECIFPSMLIRVIQVKWWWWSLTRCMSPDMLLMLDSFTCSNNDLPSVITSWWWWWLWWAERSSSSS